MMRVNLSAVYIVLVAGIALSSAGLWLARNQDERAIALQQQRVTDSVVDRIRQQQEIARQILLDTRSLLIAYPDIDSEHFRLFSEGDIASHPEIKGLGWAGREQTQGEVRFPLRLINPPGLEGLDLMASPATRALLQQAQTSDTPVAAPDVVPGQPPSVVLAVLPLNDAADGQGPDGHLPRGYVVGLFDLIMLFRRAVEPLQKELEGLQIGVYDAGSAGGPRLVYGMADADRVRWRQQRSLSVGSRQWLITSVAMPEYVARYRTWIPHIVFALGLLLTVALTLHLRTLQQRARQVERLVAQRTHELRASEERSRIIVTEAADAVITIDERGVVRSFNPAAERMFGYGEAEVVGHNVNILMPEPYHSAHDGYLAHYHQSGERRIIGLGRDVMAKRKNGDSFPAHLSVGEGEVEGEKIYVGVLSDISRRKAQEQALVRAKEEAEAANRQKSAFLNMMSHELRTPLTVILGYMPLLMDRERMPAPEVIASIVADMNVSGEHLLELINDLLDISKIEAGQLALQLEDVDAGKAVDEIVRKFTHQAADRGIGLRAEIEPFGFRVDPRRFRQVMINLVGNALKFTSQGEVVIRGGRDETEAWFEVVDSGAGMPADQLSSIFEPFRQIDSSSTRKVGGTGLGLAITKRLVALHGGEITVSSEVGRGSIFRFTISQQPREDDGEDTTG